MTPVLKEAQLPSLLPACGGRGPGGTPRPSRCGGCPDPRGPGSCHAGLGARGMGAAWEGQSTAKAPLWVSLIMNQPSYTAKKPLPKMLLLLRNSTQSRLSVEVRGSGTLLPQNLPGNGKDRSVCRQTARNSLQREGAAFLQCGAL